MMAGELMPTIPRPCREEGALQGSFAAAGPGQSSMRPVLLMVCFPTDWLWLPKQLTRKQATTGAARGWPLSAHVVHLVTLHPGMGNTG